MSILHSSSNKALSPAKHGFVLPNGESGGVNKGNSDRLKLFIPRCCWQRASTGMFLAPAAAGNKGCLANKPNYTGSHCQQPFAA